MKVGDSWNQEEMKQKTYVSSPLITTRPNLIAGFSRKICQKSILKFGKIGTTKLGRIFLNIPSFQKKVINNTDKIFNSHTIVALSTKEKNNQLLYQKNISYISDYALLHPLALRISTKENIRLFGYQWKTYSCHFFRLSFRPPRSRMLLANKKSRRKKGQ